MQFGKPFSFVFEDPDWFKKVAIMGLVSLIPILGQIVLLGWMLDIMKKMINRDQVTLPNLDFGGQLSRGFGGFVVGLVYAIPLIVLAIIQSIFIAVLTGMAEGDAAEVAGVASIAVAVCFGLLYFVLGILLYLVYPIAYGRYAEFGKISEALKFGVVFGLVKKAIGPLFIALIGALIASLIAPLGAIACGIGVLLTLVYSMAITGHFFGQAYMIATGK